MQTRRALPRRSLLALAAAAALACTAAPPARPARAQDASTGASVSAVPTTAAGFNVAWIQGKYSTCLTSTFDPDDWRRVFGRANAAGATVVRVWILEGAPMQGVQWGPGDPHYPSGVDPALLQNIKSVAAIASDNCVQVYWTAIDGNVPGDSNPGLERDRFWNIYNGDWGMGDAWRQNVLGPVVDAIATRLDVAYGLDVLNEVQGPLAHQFFRGGWTGARTFISQTIAFAHARAPGLRCSSSAGYGSAADDILSGRLDGLGVDFYDFHTYTDSGTIDQGDALVGYAANQGLPIIVGEYGQLSQGVNPTLQASVARTLLQDAQRLGFAAALAWRLEDEETRFSFFDGDQPRPAYAEVTAFTGK